MLEQAKIEFISQFPLVSK